MAIYQYKGNMIFHEKTALTVSQLNRQIRSFLETEIGEVSVTGELSNVSCPSSGHLYFTLKDSNSQIKCAFFRNYHLGSVKQFKEGMQIIARGSLSLYEARGEYQLIVRSIEEAGLGELYRQFEALKAKLDSLGLFTRPKKAIPSYPKTIGLITSPTGAALQDMLTTIARRYPLAQIKIYASEVQGKDAPFYLQRALDFAIKQNEADVLILARGGGSIEDLWAFNNEELALKIARCPIPIVSGVGHETDFTIADFVADLRAATPTAAAEAVTPNQFDLIATIKLAISRMATAVHRNREYKALQLHNKFLALSNPKQLINRYWQTLDYFERQLKQHLRTVITNKEAKLNFLSLHLKAQNPRKRLEANRAKIHLLESKLLNLMKVILHQKKQGFTNQLATLQAVSPLATLDRGYAIASFHGKVLTESNMVHKGDRIEVRLHKGLIHCEVLTNDN